MRRDAMSRLRDVLTADRLVLPRRLSAPRRRTAAPPSWLPGRAALRDGVLVWLMRAGMLAYIVMVARALETALLALQRLF